MNPVDVAATVGVALVIAGLALTVVQWERTLKKMPSAEGQTRDLHAEGLGFKIALRTTYPGLVLVAFGVLLIGAAVIKGS